MKLTQLIVLASIASCGGLDTGGDQRSRELVRQLLLVTPDGPQSDITLPSGRVFTWVQKVGDGALPFEPGAPKHAGDKLLPAVGGLSSGEGEIEAGQEETETPDLETLARDLRAYMYYGGHEYLAAEPDYEAARLVLAGAPVPATRPSRSPSNDEPLITQAQVIGRDDRDYWGHTRRSWPSRAVLDYESQDCTAFMIGPTVAMTAGHCLLRYKDVSTKSTHDQGALVPGRDHADYPFGRWPIGKYLAFVPAGWRDGRKDRYDYGMIKFHDLPPDYIGWSAPGHTVGWFGTSPDMPPKQLSCAGYPYDKGSEELWVATGKIHIPDEINSWKYHHSVDCDAGFSGAPMYKVDEGIVYGIHTRWKAQWLITRTEWNEANRWNSSIHNWVHGMAPEWPYN